MSSRQTRLRSKNFDRNVEKRGNVSTSSVKRGEGYAVGPVLLGFFLFVVVGSAILQVINTATTQAPGVP